MTWLSIGTIPANIRDVHRGTKLFIIKFKNEAKGPVTESESLQDLASGMESTMLKTWCNENPVVFAFILKDHIMPDFVNSLVERR